MSDRAPIPSGEVTPTICGMVCTCGPNLEPLACGYKHGHDGEHSWASLPTFVAGEVETPEAAVEAVADALLEYQIASGSLYRVFKGRHLTTARAQAAAAIAALRAQGWTPSGMKDEETDA